MTIPALRAWIDENRHTIDLRGSRIEHDPHRIATP
jgi:hypothetical protein